jgi:UDP-N-acetylglucosamine--N-acetylmuramyl-(pentapeptide) pyrophosphoryl-undecaprenol N-acetylglucosamine transferase
MRIALTGGGTGGHAYPAISIAEALRVELPECKLLYLGSKDGPEERLAEGAGVEFHGITGRRLGKPLSPDGALTILALGKGFCEALVALREFKPDLVIGTGGYASAAVVMAQVCRRGKTLIHEQNAIPGRTNLWLSRFVSKTCVTFEESIRYFPAGKAIVTGLPIRVELLHLPAKASARKKLGLEPHVFTLLALGGSQGARRLNEILLEAAPLLNKLPVQVIHQTGRRNYEEVEGRRESGGWSRYHVSAYFDDMRPIYAAADLALSRAGASTVAEITAVGLPAILVPYPYAYADHQRANAEFVVSGGGAVVVNESELTGEALVKALKWFVDSPGELANMAAASKRLGKPNAAGDIVAIAAGMI